MPGGSTRGVAALSRTSFAINTVKVIGRALSIGFILFIIWSIAS